MRRLGRIDEFNYQDVLMSPERLASFTEVYWRRRDPVESHIS